MKMLALEKTLGILSKYHVPAAKCKIAKDADSAAKEAKSIGYPVVLKGISSLLVHKTDAGAIALCIQDEEELRKACERIEKSVTRHTKKKPEGILVQKHTSGREIIIGMKRDPQFGPVIMFGLGGIFVETLKDVSFRIAPLEKEDCMSMMMETKGYALLEGARGEKKANLDAIAKIMLAVSAIAEKNKDITEIDLNPVMADDKSAVVVDARMMTE